ncbi:hypothetical protein GLOIN_2v1537221 [Rhizophagus clarus]|uniref:Kelch repeat protein n=1 Tax=Rhizophagus clarus TaxID=94130 RepID=A0A8H3R137_9GLOM|nr:hypothetical protein GLOIN_2v1537221 [Rhizophagus clarus]
MGHKILNHNLMLISLIHLFLWVTVVNGQFIPRPRVGHTANLVGDKIYFVGGSNFSIISPSTSDIFYYGGNQLTCNNLAGVDKSGHAAEVGGPNQDLIFIMGGVRQQSPVYQLDTKTNKINIPPILETYSVNRAFMSSVNYEGKFYLFCGIDPVLSLLSNTLNIIDTVNLTLGTVDMINTPLPRYKHTSTLVDRIMYYIGGILLRNYESMTNIYQYDIVLNTWSLGIAGGDVPGPRAAHSALKTKFVSSEFNDESPEKSIAMLDIDTLQWSIPQFNNPRNPGIPNLPNLVFHTDTFVDKLMLLAFGNDTTKIIDGLSGLNSHFYIFDFNSSEWFETTADELTNPSSDIPKFQFPSVSSVSSNISAIIGLSVGIVLVVLAIVGALIFIYYRRKKNQSKEDCHPSDDSNVQITSNQRSTLYANQQYAPSTFTSQYQQFTPQQNISDNHNNLTQPQKYSDYILSIPSDGDRFPNHSTNYYPGSESHSQRSESPPKTP